MPISVKTITEPTESVLQSIERILSDLPTEHSIREEISQWSRHQGAISIKLAKFNERYIGVMVIEGAQLKALVVHPSTRSRGVGTRMLTLLLQEIPQLHVVEMERSDLIETLIQRIRSTESE